MHGSSFTGMLVNHSLLGIRIIEYLAMFWAFIALKWVRLMAKAHLVMTDWVRLMGKARFVIIDWVDLWARPK